MSENLEIIDFDYKNNNIFGSFSNDPFFLVTCVAILFILSFCICRMIISPKEALCYECKHQWRKEKKIILLEIHIYIYIKKLKEL